jgi:hypothetical protein
VHVYVYHEPVPLILNVTEITRSFITCHSKNPRITLCCTCFNTNYNILAMEFPCRVLMNKIKYNNIPRYTTGDNAE